jgi:hypothetical protein
MINHKIVWRIGWAARCRSTEGLKNKVGRSVKLTPRMQLNNFNNQTYRMEMDVMKLRP